MIPGVITIFFCARLINEYVCLGLGNIGKIVTNL